MPRSKRTSLHPVAKQLRRDIGAHMRMPAGYTADDYYEARRRSDEAVSLAKYLIQHLDSTSLAHTFAFEVGMPGYINMR